MGSPGASRAGRLWPSGALHLDPGRPERPVARAELQACEQRRAANARGDSMPGEPDLGLRPYPRQDVLERGVARRAEQKLARGGHAAADHDLVRVECVDGIRDPDAQALAEDPERADGGLVAFVRRLDDVVAVDVLPGLRPLTELRLRVLPGELCADPVQNPPGGERLERAG